MYDPDEIETNILLREPMFSILLRLVGPTLWFQGPMFRAGHWLAGRLADLAVWLEGRCAKWAEDVEGCRRLYFRKLNPH